MTCRRRVVVALAVAMAASIIGACDDGPERLSRDAFVDQGDQLCGRYNDASGRLIAQIADEDSSVQGPDTLAAAAPVLEQVAVALRDHVGQLDLLVPPKEADAGFKATRDLLRMGADALADAAEASRAGDLDGAQRSFQTYTQAVDSAAVWSKRYGFRACGRQVAAEETEEAEQEGPPLPPAELAAFCAELRRFSDAMVAVPRTASPTELEDALLDLTAQAAALADGPPPGTGSALGEARAALEAVTKELAEHDFDLAAAAVTGSDPLAPLQTARGSLEVRVFGLGACAGAGS